MLDDFRTLDASNPTDCDKFFEKHGVGNTIKIKDRPFERFKDYQSKLDALRAKDSVRYGLLHKGTPFYFMGWTAFDMQNYQVANFYLAAAVAEDKRKGAAGWLNNPAAKGFLLEDGGSAAAVIEELKQKLSNTLETFATNTGEAITLSDFTKKFIKSILEDEQYSLITGLYSWISEVEENNKNLLLAGAYGSKETILIHLFRGCLIFETLLKRYYPNPESTGKEDGRTLSNLFSDSRLRADFALTGTVRTSASLLQDIVMSSTATDITTVFSNTAKLRNTTGHKIIWDNPFTDQEAYSKLYNQVITAILYVVAKKV